ncbi:MAG: hypothetical protein JXB38_10960, partial [Anaerolineales bacterium]|nr:hypothetical protein [Anaerolineales bacterium]
TAQFLMRNLGDTVEQMQVRFPMSHAFFEIESEIESGEESCGYSPFPPIDEIAVWVNDSKVDVDVNYETMLDTMGTLSEAVYITVPCWAHFDVTFPPGEDVTIKVTYTAAGYMDDQVEGHIDFAYVLRTGAGWKDTIGKADIVARLPYEVEELNWWGCLPEDCMTTGSEISWHYEDFEPEEDIRFTVIKPSIWQRVLVEMENIQQNPQNGEAWGFMGKAYKEATTLGKGFLTESPGPELYKRSKKAYQNAVELLPNDADWHYGFADLLCRNAEWHDHSVEGWMACAGELKQALDVNPAHERANELLQKLDTYQEGRIDRTPFVDLSGTQPDFLILTPQPSSTQETVEVQAVATGTFTPSPIIVTETPIANITLTPTQNKEQQISNPESTSYSDAKFPFLYLGVALLLTIIALGIFVWRRNQR